MKFLIYITLLFINSILTVSQHNADQNYHEFKVKIENSWNQLKEYEFLFNVASNEPAFNKPAMILTIYQANTNPSVPIKGNLVLDKNESLYISYQFSIPEHWAKCELELCIELAKSRQVNEKWDRELSVFVFTRMSI